MDCLVLAGFTTVDNAAIEVIINQIVSKRVELNASDQTHEWSIYLSICLWHFLIDFSEKFHSKMNEELEMPEYYLRHFHSLFEGILGRRKGKWNRIKFLFLLLLLGIFHATCFANGRLGELNWWGDYSVRLDAGQSEDWFSPRVRHHWTAWVDSHSLEKAEKHPLALREGTVKRGKPLKRSKRSIYVACTWNRWATGINWESIRSPSRGWILARTCIIRAAVSICFPCRVR